MGRWAEVYFTSPPEKREEAVLQLLRELEAENPDHEMARPEPVPVSVVGEGRTVEASDTDMGPGDQFDEHDLRTCEACGHKNPPSHQFCGMCGTQLRNLAETEVSPSAYEARQSGSGNEIHEVAVRREENGERFVPATYVEESTVEESPSRGDESRANPYDLSLFRSFRERDAGDDLDYEQPPSPPYRYYIGAVLAVLILALAYMAWRGSHTNPEAQQASPLPPPVSTDTGSAPPKPTTTAPSAVKASKAAEPAAASPAKETAAPSAPLRAEKTQRAEADSSARHAPAANSKPAPRDNSPQPSPQQDNGTEELAMAQRYLHGGNGQARDTSEAAKWLWRSMAKHNAPATLLLADLYLKGDGVSKNCDQARVLLDSAARRGLAGAGERLRNLQAFGCR